MSHSRPAYPKNVFRCVLVPEVAGFTLINDIVPNGLPFTPLDGNGSLALLATGEIPSWS